VPKTVNGSQAIDDQSRSNRNCGTWVKRSRKGGFLRLCYFLVAFASVTLAFATPASAANKPADDNGIVHVGGLSCFSIRAPDSPTKPETKHSPALYRSCDELCAAKGAACTATTGMHNPPYSCATTDYDPSSTLCRCCAVEQHP
jgi:hypothetical protein